MKIKNYIFAIIFFNSFNLAQEKTSDASISNYSKLKLTTHTGWAEQLRTNKILYNNNKKLFISFNQSFYHNSNLPNLENQNGNYFPKGYGSISSLRFEYNSKYFTVSATPIIRNNKSFNIDIPGKEGQFSVLNDTHNSYRPAIFQNTGFQIHFRGVSAGFGNWNQWWGPGIHNSIVMTNNSEGFYNYFIGSSDYLKITKEVYLSFKYFISKEFKNNYNENFYLSSLFINTKYKIFDFGYSRNILSGGYRGLPWSFNDAFLIMLNNKNLKYWDTIDDYYLLARFPKSNLEFFIEIGIPNRSFGKKNSMNYQGHSIGSNIGFRKKDIFGSKNLLIGAEYIRLLQSIYYNIIPSQNWYDNDKFNFSSYKNKRWAAHSGSDSDDFLLFLGYMDDKKSFIYGINFERHGVTYSFPPEVKFESRLSISYIYRKINFSIFYENEYFEHYGFVDSNQNIWNETYEKGSIQRSNTILLSFERYIY
mgnify:CR=1 FL=1